MKITSAQAQTTQKPDVKTLRFLENLGGLETFQNVLVNYKEIGNRQGQARTLTAIAGLHYRLAQYTKALKFYQQALAIHKQIGDREGVGANFYKIGSVYYGLGQYTKALEFFEQALAIHKQIGDRKGVGRNFNNIGSVYYSLGQYTKALEFFEQALAMRKQIGDREGVDTDFNNIGVVYYNLGQYTKALEFFEQALAMHKGMGNFMEGHTLYTIGVIYYDLGQYTKALEFLEQSLAINQKVGNRTGEGDSFNRIGLVYSDLGQRTKAVKSYQQGLAVYRQINDKAGEATTLDNIRGDNLFRSEYLKAFKSYQQALDIYRKFDNQAEQGKTLYKIGFVYRKMAQYAKALEFYTQALAIFKQTGLKAAEGKTLTYIGEIYHNQNQYAKALEFYTQALAIFKQTGLKAAEGYILTNIGFIYNNLGQYPKAEKTLFAAIEVRESLRPRLKDDQKISIFETQAVSYRLLQKALVAQNKNTTALEIAERGRARAFVELLASKLSPNPNIQQLKPPNIKQIQQIAQQQKATLVEYSIIYVPFQVQGKEEWHPQLYIWVVKPRGEVIFKQVNLKSLDKPLADLVTKSRTSIRARSSDAVAIPGEASANPHQKKPLQQLYQILIQPIASNLPQDPNSRVIFIPQAELFFVPFPALQDESGKYLIEKHTILTAPAIQVLQLTHQQKINKRKAIKNRTALVVGNPTMPQQLSPLPGAEQEALRIAKILNTQALTGSKATETTVKQLMQSVDVVHLATHGLLNDFKGLGVPGAIALAPSSQDDGLLTSGEIFDMKLDADLVVLSACDTGRGDIKNDGVIGLSRSLISAGAPSVIVSLWKVADDSTTLLMTEFYQNLRRNPDKAVALRNAMLSTMKQYRHPIEWAAFTLIGEAE
nr:tetratricopeptide repeat protein [Nostoc sp. FACHB-892]